MALMMRPTRAPNVRSLDGSGGLPRRVGRDRVPPVRKTRRAVVRERERRQLSQRLRVHGPLEVDDLAHRLPPARPAPLIEFRFVGAVEREAGVFSLQPQQEPPLLLADADRVAIAADEFLGKAIANPLARATDQLHVRAGEADLFVQLA